MSRRHAVRGPVPLWCGFRPSTVRCSSPNRRRYPAPERSNRVAAAVAARPDCSRRSGRCSSPLARLRRFRTPECTHHRRPVANWTQPTTPAPDTAPTTTRWSFGRDLNRHQSTTAAVPTTTLSAHNVAPSPSGLAVALSHQHRPSHCDGFLPPSSPSKVGRSRHNRSLRCVLHLPARRPHFSPAFPASSLVAAPQLTTDAADPRVVTRT